MQVIYKELKCPMGSVTHSSGEGASGGRRHKPKKKKKELTKKTQDYEWQT